MTESQKTIYVYDDFSFDIPVLLGKLYVSVIRGGRAICRENDQHDKG